MMLIRIERGPWSATFHQCLTAMGLRIARGPRGTQSWFTNRGWKRFGIPALHFLLNHGYDPEIVAENVPKELVISADDVRVITKER